MMTFCSIYYNSCLPFNDHGYVQVLMVNRTIPPPRLKNRIAKLKWLVLIENIHLSVLHSVHRNSIEQRNVTFRQIIFTCKYSFFIANRSIIHQGVCLERTCEINRFCRHTF